MSVLASSLLVSAMEHYGEQCGQCKVKFNAIELEMLVEEANKHVVELQQRNIHITQRKHVMGKHLPEMKCCG